MSEETKIEWATSTGNPWIGCTKVSPGCANCYAEKQDTMRFSKTLGGATKENPISHWGPGAPRIRTQGFWKDALRWNREHKESYDRVSKEDGNVTMIRPRIFPSLCDWLDREVPIQWLSDFLHLIHETPSLDWLLLTKRPDEFRARMLEVTKTGDREDGLSQKKVTHFGHCVAFDWLRGVFPKNVWVGTSVENQKYADIRIPQLLSIPAKLRFLSVEPMLGPVDLAYTCFNGADAFGSMPGIHWVIFGGESGPSARLSKLNWFRIGIRQCEKAKVACFVKQLGGNLSDDDLSECGRATGKSMAHPKGGDPSEWPEDLRVREFPQL